MRNLWVALAACAGIVLVLALSLTGGILMGQKNGTAAITGLPEGSGSAVGSPFSPEAAPGDTIKTAIFSKRVAPGTGYIIISLYSGDTTDPISVTVITPDQTLGPYYDGSDGFVDGRIDLKISNPDTMTPGLWKFLVHSRKEIEYGNLENLSWIRTGAADRKALE